MADESVKADVYLISDAYTFDKKSFPSNSAVVYFVDSKEIESLRGEGTIAIYQTLDGIYKAISDIYADISGIVVKEKHGDGNMNVYISLNNILQKYILTHSKTRANGASFAMYCYFIYVANEYFLC